jgi:twitching motility protein PilT
MDTHIMSLVNKEMIDPDEAIEKSQDPEGMRNKLTSMGFKLKEI